MSADRLAEIRARAEAARQAAASGTAGTPPNVDGLSVNDALDIFHESAEDVPWLLAEVERLRGALTEQTERADHEDRCAVEARVAADRLWTERDAAVAEIGRLRDNPIARRMKADRDRLAAVVERVRGLANEWDRKATLPSDARKVRQLHAALEGDET